MHPSYMPLPLSFGVPSYCLGNQVLIVWPPSPRLESAISPWDPGSFQWGIVLSVHSVSIKQKGKKVKTVLKSTEKVKTVQKYYSLPISFMAFVYPPPPWRQLSFLCFFFFLTFFFLGCLHGMWKFLGRGANLCQTVTLTTAMTMLDP